MNTFDSNGSFVSRWARRVVAVGAVAAVTAGLLTVGGTAGASAPAAVVKAAVVKASGSAACPVSAKLVPSCGVLLGVATNKLATQTWEQSVAANEQVIGRQADVLHDYHQWDTAFPDAAETARAVGGQTLMISWMGQRQNGSQVPWASIAGGAEDAVITAEALRIKALGRPVFLTFQHEPEALVGISGTAAQYVAAWRHIHDVFVAVGASNAVWAVVFMGVVSDNYIAAVQALYPGDGYVDYIGWDPYNRAACYGNPWQSFAGTVSPFYQWLMANGHANKPFLLGEYGSVEDAANPAAKANFFTGEGVSLADGEFPNLKVVSYFDHPAPPATCDWRIATSPASQAAYTAMAQDMWTRSTTPVTVPAAPAAVTAVAGTGSAAISWAAPGDTGNGMITGYRVTAAPGGLTATVPGPLPVTTATIAGLTAGTAYTFTVTATNSAGTSVAAVPSAPIVPLAPKTTIPAPAGGGWKLNRLATLVGGNLQLTDASTQYSMGTAFWPTPITAATGFTVSFDSTIGGGTGGDGVALVFADAGAGATATSIGASGSGLGYSGIPGYALALDTYKNGTDPSNNFIGLATGGDPNNKSNLVWKATSTAVPALRALHHLTVVVANNTLTTTIDGAQALSTTITVPTNTLIGFTAGNGGHTDQHLISNITITTS